MIMPSLCDSCFYDVVCSDTFNPIDSTAIDCMQMIMIDRLLWAVALNCNAMTCVVVGVAVDG